MCSMARAPRPPPLLLLVAVTAWAVDDVSARDPIRDPIRCPKGMHQCVSYQQVKCFLPDAVCDGEVDCADGSDERHCQFCRPGSVMCSGRCARRCDGVVECDDAVDEDPCPHCRGGAVLCGGRCLKQCVLPEDDHCVWRCNGVRECADGGDEAHCYRCGEGAEDLTCGRRPVHRTPGVPRPYHNVTCGQVCDGVQQCPNGWDEPVDKTQCGSRRTPNY